MLDGRILVGIGLILTLATLFLSLDILGTQKESVKLFEVQEYISSLDESIAEDESLLADGGTTWADDAMRLAHGGAIQAQKNNRKIARKQMKGLSDRFHRRHPLIMIAIASAFVSGLLGFIGVIFFRG